MDAARSAAQLRETGARGRRTGGTMKQRRVHGIVGIVAVCLTVAMPAGAGTLKCPAGSVKGGNNCIDTYEASVGQIDPTNKTLVNKGQQSKAKLAGLATSGAAHL